MMCRISVNMKTHKIGACNTIYVTSYSHLLSTHRKEGGKASLVPIRRRPRIIVMSWAGKHGELVTRTLKTAGVNVRFSVGSTNIHYSKIHVEPTIRLRSISVAKTSSNVHVSALS